jgi:glycine betaine/proline transport system permease protein
MATQAVAVRRPAPFGRLPRAVVPILALVAAAVVLASVWGDPIPSWWNFRIGPAVERAQRWIIDHRHSHPLFRWFFRPLSDLLTRLVRYSVNVLTWLTWPGLFAVVAVVGRRVAGTKAAVIGIGCLATIGVLGLWTQAIATTSLMVVSVAVALALGVPLGIASALWPRVEHATRALLDAMQVMPAYCYLLPTVLVFGIGVPAAVVATVVFALPPAVRLTAHGIRGVPKQAVEVGEAHGATHRQILTKVQLPLARPALLLGVNQTIMLALGIVVIAALVGAEGLGQEVLAGLQHLDVGQAFNAGIGILAVAMLLDRISSGRSQQEARRYRRGRTVERDRNELMIGLAVIAVAIVASKLGGAGDWPTGWKWSLQNPVNHLVDWFANNIRTGLPIIGGTAAISDFTVLHLLDPLRSFFTSPPWWLVLAAVAAVAWASAGRRVAIICAACLLAVAGLGAADTGVVWAHTMDTLSQVLIAVAVATLIAIPIGVLAGRTDRFYALIRPALDAAQVLPAFVYLVPVIALFNVGRVPGVVASVIYAVPPGIRLTALGIRQVPTETIEAAVSTGATRRQILTKVQLPLAWRSMMLGVNQMILMVLSVVIIAGLVGGGALGLDVVYGLTKSQLGLGVEAGLAIVALAVVLDRITQAWGKPRVAGRARQFSRSITTTNIPKGEAP